MLVIGRRNSSELCRNVDGTSKGIIVVDYAVDNFAIDIYNRLIAHVCDRHVFILHIIITVISPYSHGNTYESIVECLSAYTVFFNGNGKKLGNFIIVKCNLKAICNNSSFGFPSIRIVKLKNSNEFVHICKICNVDIHIVHRLCLRSCFGVIVTSEFNVRIAFNYKGSCKSCRISKFILDFEGNSVSSGCENISLLGTDTTSITRSSRNLNTVDKNLTRSDIKSRVIFCGCKESVTGISNGVSKNIAVIKSSCVIYLDAVLRICNCGKHSIIYSRAIVKSDVVNIECNYICRIRLYISTNERR